MKYCTDFGSRLREARQTAGMTQNALAEAVNISPQMVSAYEKQTREPKLETLAQIAATLGVSLDYLCGIETSESKTVQLTNYADLVEYLAVLTNYFKCSCETKEFPLDEDDLVRAVDDGDPTTYQRSVFYVTNKTLNGFIQRWCKMYYLYFDGTIPEELFETWYKGELSKLATLPLKESSTLDYPPLFGYEPMEDTSHGNDRKD